MDKKHRESGEDGSTNLDIGLSLEDLEIEITPLNPEFNIVPRAVRVSRYMAPKAPKDQVN